MAEPHDVNLTQWALGALAAAVAAGFGWLRQQLSRAEDRMTSEDAKLWQAITVDRDKAQAFRESMLERVGKLPTKDDLAAMERRIVDTLDRHHPRP